MKRRDFLSFFVGAPLAGAAIAAAETLAASGAWEAKARRELADTDLPQIAVEPRAGQVRSVFYAAPDYQGAHTHAMSTAELPSHTHSINHAHSWIASHGSTKLEIYDGENWVDFQSPAGADVINRVLHR